MSRKVKSKEEEVDLFESLYQQFNREIESHDWDLMDFSEVGLSSLPFVIFTLKNQYKMNIIEASGCVTKIEKEYLELHKKRLKEAKPILDEYKKELDEIRNEYVPRVKEIDKEMSSKILPEIEDEYLEKSHPELKDTLDKLDKTELQGRSPLENLAYRLVDISKDFIIMNDEEFSKFLKNHPKWLQYEKKLIPLYGEALEKKRKLEKEYRNKLMPEIKELKKDRLHVFIKYLPDNVVNGMKKDLEDLSKRKSIEKSMEMSADEILEILNSARK